MRKNKPFNVQARDNRVEYSHYYDRLTELAISMFKWDNLPDTVDERFMELALFGDGMALFLRTMLWAICVYDAL